METLGGDLMVGPSRGQLPSQLLSPTDTDLGPKTTTKLDTELISATTDSHLAKASKKPLELLDILHILLIMDGICKFLTPEEILTFYRALRTNKLGRNIFLDTWGELFTLSTRKLKVYPRPMTNGIFRYIPPCHKGVRCRKRCSEKARCYHYKESPEMAMLNFEHQAHVKAGGCFISKYDVVRIWLAITIMEKFRVPFEEALAAFVKMVPKPFLMDVHIMEMLGFKSLATTRNVRKVFGDVLKDSLLGNSFLVFLFGLDLKHEILNPHDFHLDRHGRIRTKAWHKGNGYQKIGVEKLINYCSRTIRSINEVVLLAGESIPFEDVLISALMAPTQLTSHTNISRHLFKLQKVKITGPKVRERILESSTNILRFPIKFERRPFNFTMPSDANTFPCVRQTLLPAQAIRHLGLHDGTKIMHRDMRIGAVKYTTMVPVKSLNNTALRAINYKYKKARQDVEWTARCPNFELMMCEHYQNCGTEIGGMLGYGDLRGNCYCEGGGETCQKQAEDDWYDMEISQMVSKEMTGCLWSTDAPRVGNNYRWNVPVKDSVITKMPRQKYYGYDSPQDEDDYPYDDYYFGHSPNEDGWF